MALFGSLLGSVAAKAGSNLLTQVKASVPTQAANLIERVTPFIPGDDFRAAGSLGGITFGNPGTGGGQGEVVVTGQRVQQNPDIRVRLRAQDTQRDAVYGPKPGSGNTGDDNILGILYQTNGVLFPYTPSISVTQDVDYKTVDLVHSNYDINTYTRTPSVQLNVNAKFTVQNQYEGRYALAALHFFRTVSKMYFGNLDGDLAGMPPPILLFSGYGAYMFNELRVVVKAHSYTFDESVDMVDVKTADGLVTRLPSLFTVSVTLAVQQTPTAMRKDFSLDRFRTGELMRRGGGWI